MDKDRILVFSLLTIFGILSTASIINSTYNASEPLYLLSGYLYLKEGHSFNTGHPLLSGIIGSIPLLFMDIDYPPIAEMGHPWYFGRSEWLFYGQNNPDTIMFWSRLPLIILGIIFGIYIYLWAKEMYGTKSGLFALFLYCFSPAILGFTPFVMTDVPVAGFAMIALYYLWKSLKSGCKKYLILSGIFYGLSLASKETAVVLSPLFIIIPFIYNKNLKKNIVNMLIFGGVAISLFALIHVNEIHPIYNSDDPFYPSDSDDPHYSADSRSPERLDSLISKFTSNQHLAGAIKYSLTHIPVPGPHSMQSYLCWAVQVKQVAKFVAGKYPSSQVYYLFAILFKTPIALFVFLAMGGYMFIKGRKKDDCVIVLSMLYPLIVFIFFLKVQTDLRYIVFPLMICFVFASRIYKPKLAIHLLMLWYAISALVIAPYFVSYFNEFIGPGNGYKILSDADTGQDLERLGIYLSKNNLAPLRLDYNGPADPHYYNIDYIPLNCTPTEGYIAISIQPLQGMFWYSGEKAHIDLECYSWLRQLEPIEKIGYTIFIYTVTSKDLMDSITK